ncbi:hypothetical protein TI05_14440, partial [Achromatium sp. WMS3]
MTKEIITWHQMLKSLWIFLEEEKGKFGFYVALNFISHANDIILPFMIGLIINYFMKYTKGDDLTIFYIYVAIVLFSSITTALIRMVAKRK